MVVGAPNNSGEASLTLQVRVREGPSGMTPPAKRTATMEEEGGAVTHDGYSQVSPASESGLGQEIASVLAPRNLAVEAGTENDREDPKDEEQKPPSLEAGAVSEKGSAGEEEYTPAMRSGFQIIAC